MIMVTDSATIGRLVQAVRGPLNTIALPGAPPVAELEALGVRRVSIGPGAHRATMTLVRQIAAELRDQGTYSVYTERMVPSAEANGLFARNGA